MINGSIRGHGVITGGLTSDGGVSGGLTAGVGGTSNYNDLDNKPSINGIVLDGNKTSHQLDIPTFNDIPPIVGYSTQELNTFTKWIDGKDIWKKTYIHNCVSGSGLQLISDEMLSYIDTLIKHESFVYYNKNQNNFNWFSIPYGVGGHADITYDHSGLFFYVKNDSFHGYVLYCTIYYTKI